MLHAAPVRGRLGAAATLTLLLALAACGSDDSPTIAGPGPATTTTTGTVLAVTVRGGSVVEGASRQRANLNQPVTIRVTSDAADEVHVHGYDKRVEVAPGPTAELTFVANIPGVFEVELERSHKLLFTLEVR